METATILLVSLGIFLGVFIQTILGFAASLIVFPIILFKLDLHQSTALMSVFFLIFSLILVPKNWRQMDKKILLTLGITSGIGTIIGIEVLLYANLLILKKLLGAMIILYVLHSIYVKAAAHIKWINKLGPVFGFVGGFSAGLFSHGGSILVIYINNKLKNAHAVRATIIGVLAVGNFIRIPALIEGNLLNYQNLPLVLASSPAFILAIFLGHIFKNKISKNLLKKLTLSFLGLAGLFLIFH